MDSSTSAVWHEFRFLVVSVQLLRAVSLSRPHSWNMAQYSGCLFNYITLLVVQWFRLAFYLSFNWKKNPLYLIMKRDPYPERGVWKKIKSFKFPKILVIYTFFWFRNHLLVSQKRRRFMKLMYSKCVQIHIWRKKTLFYTLGGKEVFWTLWYKKLDISFESGTSKIKWN